MKFFILICLLIVSSGSRAGTRDGGGGDAVALDFISHASKIEKWLELHPKHPLMVPGLDAVSFKKILDNLILETTDKILKVGKLEKDALNYPSEGRIEINRVRWSQISSEYQKNSLVLHEFLGLLDIDDTLYSVSAKIGALISNDNKNPRQFFRCMSKMNVYAKSTGDVIFTENRTGLMQYSPFIGGNSALFTHVYDNDVFEIQGSILWETSDLSESGHASINYMMFGYNKFESQVNLYGPQLPPQFGVSFGRFPQIYSSSGNMVSFTMTCFEQ